ncbi:hypothetical protein SDC9_01686 [bioreactor metagenome]|uniref:Uncharacterized protein n=1 Tax=bioreactor metagenome TaxID=1076179 RepID=A0A644SNG3_9ZZZZ
MNYIRHLTGFYEKIGHENRLNPSHISLYHALFQFWNANRFRNPISISRNEMMSLSKIAAKATYHKCIKELHDWGYIQYFPSFNPLKGSLVHLFSFDSNNEKFNKQSAGEQLNSFDQTINQSSAEQVIVPYINYSNSSNKEYNKSNIQFLNAQKNIMGDKKESEDINNDGGSAPDFLKVYQFFIAKNYTEQQARRFFNHYQAVGWLIGGRSKIINWEPVAENWMANINENNFNEYTQKNKPTLISKEKHGTANKNYRDPL